MAEQRYKAVLAVVADGRTVTEVASAWRVSRQTLHAWLARYEAEGLEGLADRSHRPVHCPHQMAAPLEAEILEMRRARPYWGPRRLALELARKGRMPVPSESAIYRCLVRAGVIEPVTRQRRREMWKRWERGGPMELWQLDVVGGFLLGDGTTAKALTGVDDHSRFCVSARLMPCERTQLVCDGFTAVLRRHGVPQQVLTDNGKVFTGRFFRTLAVAQQALDEWVTYYNTQRPHQSLGDATPASRFQAAEARALLEHRPERNGEQWVCRKVAANGLVSVDWQQVSVGKHFGGSSCDVLVGESTLQFWVGSQLLKTVARRRTGPVRTKHAAGTAPRPR